MFIDPSCLWTFTIGVYGNAASGIGGGGGLGFNFGYSAKDGFSFSINVTAQGGAIAGAGAMIGGGITYTNADNVNQLNGTAYEFGRAGGGAGIAVAVEGIKGSDYVGGTLYGGVGTGFTANSVTTSTTSALYQYYNGVHSIGNTGTTSLWKSGK